MAAQRRRCSRAGSGSGGAAAFAREQGVRTAQPPHFAERICLALRLPGPSAAMFKQGAGSSDRRSARPWRHVLDFGLPLPRLIAQHAAVQRRRRRNSSSIPRAVTAKARPPRAAAPVSAAQPVQRRHRRSPRCRPRFTRRPAAYRPPPPRAGITDGTTADELFEQARRLLRGEGAARDVACACDLHGSAVRGGGYVEPACALGELLVAEHAGSAAELQRAAALLGRAADAGHAPAMVALAGLLSGPDGPGEPQGAPHAAALRAHECSGAPDALFPRGWLRVRGAGGCASASAADEADVRVAAELAHGADATWAPCASSRICCTMAQGRSGGRSGRRSRSCGRSWNGSGGVSRRWRS